MSTFYISTPIYYVNGEPHIGHAYTTIVADAMARHYRHRGFEVFFLTGTDEHGLKVQRAAEERGISPKELADLNSDSFRRLFDKMELSYDRFIRTTDEDHKKVVLEVVRRMKENGDVYLDSYAGWYAAADEAFYDESEIEDGRSTKTGAKVEWVEEKSYFFRLSNYQQRLLDWYASQPCPVLPEIRKNEVAAFVASGLRDLSISRTTFDWGIRWPDDPEHVLYVWVDALTNYITGVGAFLDEELFEKFWPCDIHLIGKDILRFHAVYWPAFLMSAGVAFPKEVFAHGWWMSEGQKMSKSLGNFIDAFELADRYPMDLLRYYLLREIPLGSDGNFVHHRVIGRNNSELADNLGNLVNRAMAMTAKFVDSKVPEATDHPDTSDQKTWAEIMEIQNKAEFCRDEVFAAMDARETHRALERIMEFSSDLNQYVAVTQPWALNKKGLQAELQTVMYNLLEGIRWLAELAAAFIPKTAETILKAFGRDEIHIGELVWGGLEPGGTVTAPDVLFAKIELPEEPVAPKAEKKAKPEKTEKKTEKAVEAAEGIITFDQFVAVQLKVAHVLEAERVEGSDKLLKLTIDAGEPEQRTVVAGIGKAYGPEDVKGLRVAMVANLAPRKVFGVLSQGMLLAVENEDGGLELARYSDKVKPGTRIS